MRHKLLITATPAVVLSGAVVGFVLARGSGGTQSAANPDLPPATATVTRTTLVETKTVSGTLGYGEPVPIRAAERGTLTRIAPAGSIVARGQPLFRVDERRVVAFYGSLPLYRALRDGTKGRDVRQFEQNLAALGYTGFAVDDTYTAATATAVCAWQADLGSPVTGTVELSQVMFTPGPVRIAERTARVGDGIEVGTAVLSYTSTVRVVTVELDVADRALAVKDRRVAVMVPGLRALTGNVSEVGTVITTQGPTAAEGSTPEGASTPPADPRVQVTVTIANQKALGSLDAAPVDVDFVSNERENVLAVPVVALLALPQGGFGVQVVNGATTRIVPVKTGMFAGGQVEISGTGITDGVMVGVPK